MYTVKCRSVVAMAIGVVALAALVSAQITFSRDWTGGKRAASQPDAALDCTQFTRLCRHFVHELKAAMSAEVTSSTVKRRRTPDDGAPLYDDEQ